MSTRIRLQRHGKKSKPFFHIVVADQRSKRDGRFIEKLGSYNPNTNPATIDIDFDRSLYWVGVGAEPSDTARAILSYKGVMMRDHLRRGVLKGALTEEQAEAKFTQWLTEKEAKVQAKRDNLAKESDSERKSRLAAEKKVNEERAAAIVAANTPEEVVTEVVEAAEEAVTETAEAVEAAAEVVAEVAEEVKEEVVEAAADVAETVAEAAEEVKEEVVEAAKEAAPESTEAEEASSEEASEEESK